MAAARVVASRRIRYHPSVRSARSTLAPTTSQQHLCLSESSTFGSLSENRNCRENVSIIAEPSTDRATVSTNGHIKRKGSVGDIEQRETLLSPTNLETRLEIRDEDRTLYINEYTGGGYGSIFTQIREVNKESKGDLEYLAKSFRIIRGTAIVTVLLMMVLIFPFAMVILGVKYLNECPKEPFVPIYLLVGGCFWMLKMFTVLWRQMRERKSSDSVDTIDGENQSDFITDRSTQFTDMVLSLFLLVWFGFGNYWTWKIFQPNFSMQLYEPTDWCEKTLYMFCVIQILSCYAAFVLFLCTVGCLCCARHVCYFTDKQLSRAHRARR